MGVTRRQGLLAMAATLGGIVLNGFLLGRLRSLVGSIREAGSTTDRSAGQRAGESRGYRVQPDPHSVKRHA
jgi:hypothetical protein